MWVTLIRGTKVADLPQPTFAESSGVLGASQEVGVQVPEDFSDWLCSQRDGLLRSALMLTGQPSLAEDLVQEAAVKVAQRWARLRGDHPTAYARRIIYRDHVSWWRRQRERPVDQVPDWVAPDAGVGVEVQLVLVQALARLPRGQRAVIVLRYLDDLTERETADVLGVSVGTVKSQAHAALHALRRQPGLEGLLGTYEREQESGSRD